MALIAKRKVATTWRRAVAERAAETNALEACLARFDALLAAGETDATAAYRALEAFGLLWVQPMPGDPKLPPPAFDPEEDVPAV